MTIAKKNSRIEYGWLAIILIIGLTMRLWRINSLGLNHFDEGVYAISGLWSVTNPMVMYENQHLFSPLLYPLLIGIGYFITGWASDTTAILVNVIFGAASILLAWWIARRWFGSFAGLATAILLTTSEYLITYSRMALTDMVFGFFFLLSLALLAIAYEKGSYGWAILAGIGVGAAWNTKYHGWFLIIIAWATIFLLVIMGDLRKQALVRRVFCSIIITGVAVICFFPWVLYVQNQPGGFLGLLQYQRLFVHPTWSVNFYRQVQNQMFIDGWMSRTAPAMSYLLIVLLGRKSARMDWLVVLLITSALLASGILLGGVVLSSLLCFGSIFWLIKARRYFEYIILSALGLLFITTPLYQPYPRLMVVWVLCIYLVSGYAIGDRLVQLTKLVSAGSHRLRSYTIGLALGISLIAIGISGFTGIRPDPHTWMATDDTRRAAEAIKMRVASSDQVFVYGAPELAFYLIKDGNNVIPIDAPVTSPVVRNKHPWLEGHMYLVTGIYPERRDPRGRDSLKRLNDRLQKLAGYPMQPNDERLLNDFSPVEARKFRSKPGEDYNIILYRVLSKPASN